MSARESLFDALVQKAAEIIDAMGAGRLTPDEAYSQWQYESQKLREGSQRETLDAAGNTYDPLDGGW